MESRGGHFVVPNTSGIRRNSRDFCIASVTPTRLLGGQDERRLEVLCGPELNPNSVISRRNLLAGSGIDWNPFE